MSNQKWVQELVQEIKVSHSMLKNLRFAKVENEVSSIKAENVNTEKLRYLEVSSRRNNLWIDGISQSNKNEES